NLSGALTITLGNLDLTTNTETMVVDRGITLADAAEATLTTNSNVTASGTITVNNAATITVSAGTWILNDDSDQTVDFDGQSLYGLTINNTGAGTNDDIVIAADSQLNLSGALTITLGNLDLTTNTETMVVDRGITLADAAQATLTTNSNVTASGTITVNDAATITVSAGTWTLTTNTETMVVDAGITLAAAAQATLTTNTDVTASGSITTNADASITVTAGTWTLNGHSQNFDTNNSLLYSVVVASSATTTLTSDARVSNSLQINTGSTLSLSTFRFHATGATLLNFGTVTEGTGKLVHSGATLITDGSTEKTSFNSTDTVHVQVTDPDGNLSGTAGNTISATLTLTGGDSETITLTETTNTSGIFKGSIPTRTQNGSAGNGHLETTSNGTITATFTDAQDGLVATDTASFVVFLTSPSTSPSPSPSPSPGGSGRSGGGSLKKGTTAPPPPPSVKPTPTKLTPKQETLKKKVNALEKRKQEALKKVTPAKKASPAKKTPAKKTSKTTSKAKASSKKK
ncbi:MAG: hypothetical protein Greene041619_1264, partial [Candidatus Peregrinibacteria bacterium Greene0416_19]